MKIALIDCSVSGHRETYYRTFARTWAELGHQVLLVAPRPSGTDDVARFLPIDARPLRPLPTDQPLRKKLTVLQNAAIRLRNLATLARQLKPFAPDLVYFTCLDDMLPTLGPCRLMQLLFPYRWSGLLVQSALPPYKWYLPDVRPALRSSYCQGVGVLNEYSADSLKAFQPHVYRLPDFADLSTPDPSYPLLQTLKERAAGRKIVSLLGSISERKGLRLLMDSIPLLPASDYFFCIAGRSWLTDEQTRRLKAFEATHDNCLFALEHIPDEACFNALVTASDLLFAVYRHFSGSSNLLTKAAAFGRPIVVARGQCMGRRVEQYATGLAVPEDDTRACAAAIERLCTPQGRPTPDACRRYADEHSIGRLKTALQENLTVKTTKRT